MLKKKTLYSKERKKPYIPKKEKKWTDDTISDNG